MSALMCERVWSEKRRWWRGAGGKTTCPYQHPKRLGSDSAYCPRFSLRQEIALQPYEQIKGTKSWHEHSPARASADCCFSPSSPSGQEWISTDVLFGGRRENSVREREGEREKVHARESARGMWTKAIGWKFTLALAYPATYLAL